MMNEFFRILGQPQWRPLRWALAMLIAVLVHVVVIALFLWRPNAALELAPAAAPQIFQVSMVAAPKSTMMQEESEPQQAVIPQVKQPIVVPTQSEVIEIVEPVSDKTSDYIVKKQKKLPKETEQIIEESVVEDVTPIVEEVMIEKEVEKTVNQEQKMQQAQASSVPSLNQTKEAEQASAPRVGALNELEAQAIVSWKNNLAAHLERRKRYPRAAQIRGQQGVPWVSFTMNRLGNVLNAKLHRSSGVEILDREVLALVQRAQPLPIPPEHTPDSALIITVPVAFFIQ